MWTRVPWWGSQDAECSSYSSINRWPCSTPKVFNSRPGRNSVSGAPGLGHLVHYEEVGLGCWYARSTGGGYDGSWKDFHLRCSGNALEIRDWESCNVVATVHFMGEYPSRVGDFGTQRLSQHCRLRTGVVSTPEIELCDPTHVGDTDNTTSQVSSTCISPWTNLGGFNARSGRDHQDCHRRDDTSNLIQTGQLVPLRKCESHQWESQYWYWWVGKPMQYAPGVVWYLNTQSETIK